MLKPRTRIKICGMTRKEDIDHAIKLGVDAVGLIFYSKSSRCVSIEQAKNLLREFPIFMDAVAVLVNPKPSFVQQIINELPITILQFHGDETPAFCDQFNWPYIKTVNPKTTAEIKKITEEFIHAKAILLDSVSETSRGGTGQPFDWRLVPHDSIKPCILAGGLNEFNILDAIKRVKPFAVDVCSGVECSPGIKDLLKMDQLIKVLWGIQ